MIVKKIFEKRFLKKDLLKNKKLKIYKMLSFLSYLSFSLLQRNRDKIPYSVEKYVENHLLHLSISLIRGKEIPQKHFSYFPFLQNFFLHFCKEGKLIEVKYLVILYGNNIDKREGLFILLKEKEKTTFNG